MHNLHYLLIVSYCCNVAVYLPTVEETRELSFSALTGSSGPCCIEIACAGLWGLVAAEKSMLTKLEVAEETIICFPIMVPKHVYKSVSRHISWMDGTERLVVW